MLCKGNISTFANGTLNQNETLGLRIDNDEVTTTGSETYKMNIPQMFICSKTSDKNEIHFYSNNCNKETSKSNGTYNYITKKLWVYNKFDNGIFSMGNLVCDDVKN